MESPKIIDVGQVKKSGPLAFHLNLASKLTGTLAFLFFASKYLFTF